MRTNSSLIVTIAIATAPVAAWAQFPPGAPTAGSLPPANASGSGGSSWGATEKPSMTERLGSVFKNNPLSNAWSSWREREEQEELPSQTAQHDPISLANPTPPPSPDLLLAAAKLSERNGQIDTARKQFHQALTMAPQHVEGLIEFGRLEDRQGNLRQAERHYRTAVSVDPHNATALNDLALCVARQGNLDESVALLERAIEIHPDKALYRNNIATVLVEQRSDDDALAHLAEAHGAAPANYNLGLLLSKRGRPQDAAEYFQAALQQDPQMSEAAEALASVRGDVPHVAESPRGPEQAPPQSQQQGPQMVAPQMAPPNRPATAGVSPRVGYRQPIAPQSTPWSAQKPPVRTLPPVGQSGGPVNR